MFTLYNKFKLKGQNILSEKKGEESWLFQACVREESVEPSWGVDIWNSESPEG